MMPPMIVMCISETKFAQYGPTNMPRLHFVSVGQLAGTMHSLPTRPSLALFNEVPMNRKPLIWGKTPCDQTGKWLPMALEELAASGETRCAGNGTNWNEHVSFCLQVNCSRRYQESHDGIAIVAQDIDLSACKNLLVERIARHDLGKEICPLPEFIIRRAGSHFVCSALCISRKKQLCAA